MIFLKLILISSTVKAAIFSKFFKMITPPEDISKNGHLIDSLFNYITYANIFFFLLVCIGLFGFSILYRKSRHPKAYYTHGNKRPHIILASLVGLLVFVTIDMKITTMSNDDFTKIIINWPKESEDVVRIEVLGQQWVWNFRYAGEDKIFNTDDDIVLLNELYLPKGKKIVFQLTSKDVIHALYFPNARRKVDAMPGRISRMWFELTKTGQYDIACAEMCGTYHYRMKSKLHVLSQDDYKTWTKQAQIKANETIDPENEELFWGWKWEY